MSPTKQSGPEGRRRQAALDFLTLINEAGNVADLIRKATAFFQEKSGCEAVGIRLREGVDFPFFEARGFPAEFLLHENSICARDKQGRPLTDASGHPVRECRCGQVLDGRFDAAKTYFTPGGSFWTNSTTSLLSALPEEGRPERLRNRCQREGFESMALIPLCSQKSTLGLVQLSDRRPGRFSAGSLVDWEDLGRLLAVALAKFKAEEAVSASERRYRSLFNEMTEGFALHRILCDREGRPVDYRFLEVNPGFERIMGRSRGELVGHLMSEVFPEEGPSWLRLYGEVALSGQSMRFEHDSAVLRGTFEVFAYSPEPGQFATLIRNLSERKRDELVLRRTIEELARSNEELEQFVNVASHDLKEPLRMVTAFLSLLQERAKAPLDDSVQECIVFASGAATRMQRLIDDLLAYSRLGSGGHRETMPADDLLDMALENVRMSLVETGGVVTRGPLPVVEGNRMELTLVFQNLIGNALKFCKGRTPIIGVEARRERKDWRFTVSDNGIGIAPEYRERIFMIFERLHTAEHYQGSGMGLAICRKIVERHGGRIWVESEPGRGSQFHFTIPGQEGEGYGRING